ncbi:class I SAM-dependent methyltransferase [Candidatus Woesearchaeota archaeon]|nr:class I SAM-dependent methyltransferase [Candidatus Woesearchaeota archaeon]
MTKDPTNLHLATVGTGDPLREPYIPLLRNIVTEIFSKHIRPTDRIIEIGSGLGFLVNDLVPEYRGRVQQTDGVPSVVRKHRELRPDSNIKLVDVFSNDMSKASYDVVLGLNTLDSITNRDALIGQISGILNPGGRMIHLRDYVVSFPSHYHGLQIDHEAYIPLFACDSEGKTVGFRLVRKTTIQKSKRLDDRLRRMLLFDYQSIYQDGITSAQVRRELSEMGKDLSSQSPILTFAQLYGDLFRNALAKAELGVVEEGRAIKETVEQRAGLTAKYPNENVFVYDAGQYRKSFDPKLAAEIGQQNVKKVARLDYLVAKKAA